MASPYNSEAGALPHSIKVLGGDGRVREENVKLSSKPRACCGLLGIAEEGEGGSSFGAMRVASSIFWFLRWFLFAPNIVVHLIWFNWLCLAMNILLFIGGLLSEWAAFSHEGLSDEARNMAEQNDRFAENNENMKQQLGELGDVRQKLDLQKASLGSAVAEFASFVERFHKVNNMNLITNILEAYLQADSLYGDRNKELEGKEASYFFTTAKPVLEEAFPDKVKDGYFKRMKDAAKEHGFDLWGMSMLATAVVHNEDIKKSNAHLALVMCSLDGNLAKCADIVALALADKLERIEILHMLSSWQGQATEGNGGLVPRSKLVKLTRAINDDGLDVFG